VYPCGSLLLDASRVICVPTVAPEGGVTVKAAVGGRSMRLLMKGHPAKDKRTKRRTGTPANMIGLRVDIQTPPLFLILPSFG
jgi:hypothetical protein